MEYRVMLVDGVWCVVAIASREASKEAAIATWREMVAVDMASQAIMRAAREVEPSEMARFLERMPAKGDRTPESIEAWLDTLTKGSRH